MGIGASVSSNSKAETSRSRRQKDINVIEHIQTEITRLDDASKDTNALDEFIDASQTYSNTSTISRVPAVNLVTESVQKTINNIDGYFDNVDKHFENLQAKLGEFKEAVFERCEQYSEDEKLNKLSRARQQINVVDELILKAKGRLIQAKKDNKTSEMVKSMKRQVQDLEMFKSDLKASRFDSARSKKNEMFEKVLQSEGSEYVIEDILKWRDEALKLRRKYESLLDDNEKLRTESENEIITLQNTNQIFIKELTELRQETDMADEKVKQSEERVQLVEEKLLDERLSHEVEINSLKAMLEKKDEILAKLMGSNPVTPGPEHEQVRLSPEGIVGTSDSESKYKTSDSRSPSPSKENDANNESKGKGDINTHNGNSQSSVKEEHASGKDNADDFYIKRVLQTIKPNKQNSNGGNNVETNDKEITEEQTEKIERTEENSETQKLNSTEIVSSEKEKDTESENRQDYVEQTNTNENGTKAQDIVLYEEGTVKEIVYKRNDSEIDGNLSYHKGVGAVLQTCNQEFGVDSVSCEIIDELENNMLPDFVEGERAVSFQLHFQKKLGSDFTLKEGESFKLFLPHRTIHEFEEASLIQSVNGEDWEPCDPLDETPSSIDDVQMVCLELYDLTDIKLIAIAREKIEYIIAGEGDIDQKSKYDQTVTLKMSNATFKSRTEVKLLVHDTHRREMLAAIEIHDECKQIMSCTTFVSLLCEQITKEDISVIMKLQEDIDAECKYTMFSLDDYGWTLADCDWQQEEKELVVHLRAGAKKYRILGLELPKDMSAEEKLEAVRVLHDHTSHYLVRLLFRQREDDPTQAVVICLRSKIVKTGIYELKELGYSVGGYPSSQFCLLEGDTLSLQFSGDITAKPVHSEKMEMTFYPQKEIATKQLLLQSPDKTEDDEQNSPPQGFLSILKKNDTQKIILGETINFQIESSPKDNES
ncbi:uncharacterized protein LOC123523933 [Mercenaria mercenaria]|uniref:uncharacterized protein LOC123523933 n=1 Tax=Mercenaria mercenaria TaxID=6596 RepID=UPI00234EF77B|nr:uncharacterized protein LOC123523933 [Mercenaria mercenaria]